MLNQETLPKLGSLVAVLAAALGLVGYVVFGWRFGESNGSLPFILGVSVALFAIGWTLYQRW